MDLTGKVAVITGSGRGIGKTIALRLANAGATIVINDVGDPANAENTAAEIRALKRDCLVVMGDISTTADAIKVMDTAAATYNHVDILVNNAGITRDRLLIRMTDDEWDKVIAINLRSVFVCTRAVLKYMTKQRWGRIVNMASVVGIAGNAGQANYSASKAGIIGFTKSVSKEVGSRNITVNAIAPGFIDTQMTQNLEEAWKEEIKKRIPLGMLGSPQDVAEAVAFLASDEARYITGHVLNVDGGMTGI